MNTTKKNLFCVFLCAIMMIFALALLAPMSSMKGVYADDVALDETTATVKVTNGDAISYYASFADAVSGASSGATLTLLKDSQICNIQYNSLTIDLNGKTLSVSGTAEFKYSNITIRNSIGMGKISRTIYYWGTKNMSATIESGEIDYFFATDNPVVYIKGGEDKYI